MMMPFYTIVDDGYNVDLYRTRKAAIAAVVGNDFALAADAEDPASDTDIAKAVRAEPIVRLYKLGERDWAYRIERHARAR
jgi:hypothetical protein